MSWLDWAIYDPAPLENAGYVFGIGVTIPKEVPPDQKRGGVVHSSEGYFTYINPSAVMRARGNSWDVTVMRSGAVWKHRERPTFVNWHAGGPAQNTALFGMEVEGLADDPWTLAQRESVLRVLVETWAWFGWPQLAIGSYTRRTQDDIRARILALGYGSAWEHRWLDYTSCPSDRNQWTYLNTRIAAMEGEMTPEQLALLMALKEAMFGGGTLFEGNTDRVSLVDQKVAALRQDTTGADTGLRADIKQLRQDATGADDAIRARLNLLEAPQSGEGLKRGDTVQLT